MGIFSRALTDAFAELRHGMVDSHLRARGIRDERVLAAMERVPRHEFVAEEYRAKAYEDHPLAIGEGQTISQPYIVAIMLEALALRSSDSVLEVGTGSGYQTALLAELVQQVYSIERHEALAREAGVAVAKLGYANVSLIVGDGTEGFVLHEPYDAIIVAAAAPRIPQSLFDQLREGGRMVIPVGPREGQQLELVRKLGGQPLVTRLGGCAFVPLIGSQGYGSGW